MAPRPQGRGRAPGSRLRPASAAGSSNHRTDLAQPSEIALRNLFEEASRVPPPDLDELAGLLQRAGAGDEGARDTLFKSKMDMVGRLAAARTERGLPFGDLVQEGSIGLMGAIDYFRASGSSDFDRFAEEQVAAQMEAAIENETAAVRDAELVVEAAEIYEKAELALARELGRAPTEEELSRKLEWTLARTAEIGAIVDEARRLHDEELLQFLEAEALDGEIGPSEEDRDG